MKKSKQQGFTLIELMITVALIAIVAVIGYTLYQKHAARSKVSQGLSLASRVKTAVEKKYHASGTSAPHNKGYGLPPANRINNNYVKSVAAGRKGLITIAYKDNVPESGQSGSILVLAPQARNGAISWQCGSPNIAKTYLPDHCRPNKPTPNGISPGKTAQDKKGKNNGNGSGNKNSSKNDQKSGDSKGQDGGKNKNSDPSDSADK